MAQSRSTQAPAKEQWDELRAHVRVDQQFGLGQRSWSRTRRWWEFDDKEPRAARP